MEKWLIQIVDELKFVRKEIKDMAKKNEELQNKVVNFQAALLQVNKQMLVNLKGGQHGNA